jgi:hypothetical protein
MSDPRIAGGNRKFPDGFLDPESGGMPSPSLEHAAIHDGFGFWLQQEVASPDFDIAAPILFDILTPAAPHIHLKTIEVYHTATSALLEIIEAPDITPGTTPVPIINLNRQSSQASGVSVFSDPSGISGGTLLLSATLLNASPVAPVVDKETDREIILKENARTLVRLTSAQDNQLGRVGLFFYIDRHEG